MTIFYGKPRHMFEKPVTMSEYLELMKKYKDGTIKFECEVTDCWYSTFSYKQFLWHLRQVHHYKYLELPAAFANSLEKHMK